MVTLHIPTVWAKPANLYAQPITRGVAAMNSCFGLVRLRPHQHGIARRMGLTKDHRPRCLLERRTRRLL